VNADLFFLLALQQACEEGIAHLRYPSRGCSVVPLHTGSPYSGCGLAWQIGAQVRPVPSCKMGPAQHCCPHLSLARSRALGLASLNLAPCRLAKEPSPAELELK
jgi:hypothetical protein